MSVRERKAIAGLYDSFSQAICIGMGRTERREALALYTRGSCLEGDRKSLQAMANRLAETPDDAEALRQRLQQGPPMARDVCEGGCSEDIASALEFTEVSWRSGSKGEQRGWFAATRVYSAERRTKQRNLKQELWLIAEWRKNTEGRTWRGHPPPFFALRGSSSVLSADAQVSAENECKNGATVEMDPSKSQKVAPRPLDRAPRAMPAM